MSERAPEKLKDSNIEAHMAPLEAQLQGLDATVHELHDAVTVCVRLLEGVSADYAAHPELQRVKALLGA
jgi:hypothetical protein